MEEKGQGMNNDNQVKVRLPDNLMARLFAAAKANCRSVAQEVSYRVRVTFDLEDKEDKK